MPFTTSIVAPTISIRSSDERLAAWLEAAVGAPVSTEVNPESRLVIYGDDHDKFLPTDNFQQKLVRCHAALCITGPLDASYLDLYRHNVRHVIFRQQPFALEAFRLAILTAGPSKALAVCHSFREFQPPPVILDTLECPVVSTEDTNALKTCTDQFFQRYQLGEDLRQSVNLVLKEAITNAKFHGFREAGSHDRKYTPKTFHGLYDSDYIAVKFALTPNWLAVRVWDNSGSLGPLSVANSLDRHLTSRGLMDTRGRGFYLMQNLSHRLVVCVRRREETSVQAYFQLDETGLEGPRHFEVIAL